jgi:curved DNA-binding protein CbpA
LRGISTHYEILGVSATASALELKTAYRRLLRQAHPDMGGSAALLDLVNEAYDTLKDPSLRARYDASLR